MAAQPTGASGRTREGHIGGLPGWLFRTNLLRVQMRVSPVIVKRKTCRRFQGFCVCVCEWDLPKPGLHVVVLSFFFFMASGLGKR